MSLNIVNSFKLTPPPPVTVGGWKEAGRTTLGGTADSITVSSLADKRYYMVLSDAIQLSAANINVRRRVGNGSLDTGTNYALRSSSNGAADATDVNDTSFSRSNAGSSSAGTHLFDIGYWANLSTKEKLYQGWQTNVQIAGPGTAPRRIELAGKWSNTVDPIDTIGIFNTDGGDYATGSELVVLEWDPTDTHTDNFWEELAVDELVGTADVLDVSFTPKKYLWFQFYIKAVTAGVTCKLTFNNDSGANYARRRSANGGADTLTPNASEIALEGAEVSQGMFGNSFVINNLANEKLMINSEIQIQTLGAASAPDRREIVAKWINTSEQIDQITLSQTSGGDYGAGSILKVWGSD